MKFLIVLLVCGVCLAQPPPGSGSGSGSGRRHPPQDVLDEVIDFAMEMYETHKEELEGICDQVFKKDGPKEAAKDKELVRRLADFGRVIEEEIEEFVDDREEYAKYFDDEQMHEHLDYLDKMADKEDKPHGPKHGKQGPKQPKKPKQPSTNNQLRPGAAAASALAGNNTNRVVKVAKEASEEIEEVNVMGDIVDDLEDKEPMDKIMEDVAYGCMLMYMEDMSGSGSGSGRPPKGPKPPKPDIMRSLKRRFIF